ncbi:MAG: hypothetical protein SH856_05510 [Flavobacteriales bacterium]|nr:hypothetical protein [Flavobacteriales bacterium]
MRHCKINTLEDADFNSDGAVNTSDLLMLMSAFGCHYDCGILDLNCDSAVNVLDVILFMGEI